MFLNRRGAALVVVLVLITVIGGISTLMFSRTISEIRNSASNAAIVQTLMMARGAANAGGSLLTQVLSQDLNTLLLNNYSRTDRWAFGGNGLGDTPNPQQVSNDLASKVAQNFQSQVDAKLCNLGLPAVQGGSISLRIYFTNTSSVCGVAKALPSAVKLSSGRFVSGMARDGSGSNKTQKYALPFVLVSEAVLGQYRRNVVLQGEYQFELGVKNFARYALFTNFHTSKYGDEVWFFDKTEFNGPIHTNQNFRFHGEASFGGKVTSAGCINPDPNGAGCLNEAYQQGGIFFGANDNSVIAPENMAPSNIAPSYSNDFGLHQPKLNAGVSWNTEYVPLPSSADLMAQQASSSGLLLTGSIAKVELYAGKNNEEPLNLSGGKWMPSPAPYQYIKTCTPTDAEADCTLRRYGSDNVLYKKDSNGSWVQEKSGFNGIIFADGPIANLTGPGRDPATISDPNSAPPAIASFAKLTVANQGTNNNIQIQGDLTYESVPCPEQLSGDVNAACSNLEAQNILGVYSEDADIRLGDGSSSSLLDLTVHGVLMSRKGSVEVASYDTIAPRGSVRLLGGLISNYYGIFGQFTDTGLISGYGRKFTYDQRMAMGSSPPYFPGAGFSEGDTPVVISFGQREQVY